MSGLLLDSTTPDLKAQPRRRPHNTPRQAMQTHQGAAQSCPGSHSIPSVGQRLLRSCCLCCPTVGQGLIIGLVRQGAPDNLVHRMLHWHRPTLWAGDVQLVRHNGPHQLAHQGVSLPTAPPQLVQRPPGVTRSCLSLIRILLSNVPGMHQAAGAPPGVRHMSALTPSSSNSELSLLLSSAGLRRHDSVRRHGGVPTQAAAATVVPC